MLALIYNFLYINRKAIAVHSVRGTIRGSAIALERTVERMIISYVPWLVFHAFSLSSAKKTSNLNWNSAASSTLLVDDSTALDSSRTDDKSSYARNFTMSPVSTEHTREDELLHMSKRIVPGFGEREWKRRRESARKIHYAYIAPFVIVLLSGGSAVIFIGRTTLLTRRKFQKYTPPSNFQPTADHQRTVDEVIDVFGGGQQAQPLSEQNAEAVS
ncbi:hypothetical protein Q1695_010707 [Nippostrongylus brasiliensis]|nr:hypothetical protein Q1695_010707 [Nippostrongylus brasiliensis]